MKRTICRLPMLVLLVLFIAAIHPKPAAGIGFAHTVSTRVDALPAAGTATARAAVIKALETSAKHKPTGIFKKGGLRSWLFRKLVRFLPHDSMKADRTADAALVCGIISLFLFPLAAPLAIALGITALEDGTRKKASAIIGIVLGGLVTLFMIFLFIVLLAWAGI